ncbi:MAG: S8 family peptidase [Lewinellaceae bacterium]|nr:S8 family peptidase [Lewinellaceae bacterium]
MKNTLFILTKKSLPVLTAALLLSAPMLLNGQNLVGKLAPGVDLKARDSEPAEVRIVVSDLDSFCKQLREKKWPVTLIRRYDPGNIAIVKVPKRFLADSLLPLDMVLFVDRGRAEPREELPVPGHNLFTNNISYQQALYPGWNGEGRTVSVMERRFDTADVDLRGRVAPMRTASQELTSHASVMASLIAGAGNSDPAGRGAAWGCRLASSDFAALLPDPDSEYEALDVSVQNHSYGVGIENYYGADALAYDQSVRLRPALLHVFSAGNLGEETSSDGPYKGIAGYANLTGSFKMAKNALLVGAVDTFGRVVPFSSRGPAYDGRLKPDLVAFGPDGSSGSSALVAGVAAVLQQAYASEQGGALPTAALVRAVLVNTADDVETPGPDFRSGYGNMNAYRAAATIEKGRYMSGHAAGLEEVFVDLNIPPGQSVLKVTLCWDDPPAQAGAPFALVNDLDLSVIGPGGQGMWLPWVLHTKAHPDSLNLGAVTGRDSINNTEQVLLTFPVAGQYRIRIFGRRVTGGAQAFSVAYDWRSAGDFQWRFPDKQDAPFAAKPAVLHWDSDLGNTTGELYWRLAGDTSWVLANTSIPLSDGFCRWQVPDTIALAQLRMKTGGQAYDSDTFLLAPALHMNIGFNCPDSVLLFWEKAAGPLAYRLWGLADRYLTPVLSVADTQVVLDKAIFPYERFAVTPHTYITGNFEGVRSSAPGIADQGVDCYFRSLLADLDGDDHVQLSCLLGSTYAINKVRLQKQIAGVFADLFQWDQPGQLVFNTIDSNLLPGINRYRAVLETGSGALLYSDTVVVYSAGRNEYFVFPNPVTAGEVLNVISQSTDDDTQFALFDPLGRQILETPMPETLLEVPLPLLAPGVCFYTIRQGGKVRYAGKVSIK